MRLSCAFRHHREYMRHTLEVSTQELELIQFIVRYGPKKMRDIATHFYLKLSTLTSIVDKAEGRGHVKRMGSEADGRVVLLDVTPAGRQVYLAYHAYLQETVQQMVNTLDPQVLEHFVEGVESFNRLSLGDPGKNAPA